VVDRNVLRLALWEMTNTQTPPKVVIDQAIELAKSYSTEQSPAFVNGVLDAALKETQALKAQ
jgi:N utilization substance protein B